MKNMINFGLKLAVGSILTYCALWTAFMYGGIWQSQAHPSRVTVYFDANNTASGLLHRDWQNAWVLVKDAGGELHFRDAPVIAYTQADTESKSKLRWRSMMPVLVAVVGFILCLLGMVRSISDASTQKP
jgi:hypothetical protein